MPDPAETAADKALTITRIIDAPPERVFDAWIDPAQLARWLGPPSITAEIERLDLRPGGAYRIRMRRLDGSTNIITGTYREIAPPERLVFTWIWEGAAAALNAGQPSLVTVSLAVRGGKTEMTLRHERLVSPEARDSHRHGWAGSFDRLSALLAGGHTEQRWL